jgi:hypothetical protein
MAETSVEGGETVEKSENENKSPTEDKEIENVLQNIEVSKSENDNAASESTLKNMDAVVESSVEADGSDGEKKDGGKEELVSDSLNNEVSFIFIEIN